MNSTVVNAARETLPHVRTAAQVLDRWRAAHPNILDYRIEDAARALRHAAALLDRLDTGSDPEQAAALAEFRTRYPLPGPPG